MSNRFATAGARIASRLKSRIGNSVTYSRKSGNTTTTETITAWRGNEQEDVTNPGGQVSRVDSTDRDYLFLATDLAMGEPEEGDRITDGSETFEVKPVQGNPAWRWSDESRLIRRVHTKQV